jgi:NOL1/NOP2/fmu family ribosome biogenesis protein
VEQDDIIAIPKEIVEDYALLKRYLNISKVGVKLGKITNGKALIPDHELALFTGISKVVSSIELEEHAVQLFLKRQDFPILESFESGWQLVKYQNYAFGWVKIIGNRMNNYYPKEIKMVKEF